MNNETSYQYRAALKAFGMWVVKILLPILVVGAVLRYNCQTPETMNSHADVPVR